MPVAAFVYGLNLLLGVATLRRWQVASRFPILHHLLYGLSFAVAALAFTQALLNGSRQAYGLGAVLVVLALFPRARGGSTRHLQLALLGLTTYLVTLLLGF